MPFPRVRLTVRRMMVAVAIVGVGLGLLLQRRAVNLRLEAARHAGDGSLVSLEEVYNPTTDAGMDHHQAMAEKYRQAALHPWLPVASDPPDPESAGR